jgi:outer membrane protein OmpU
MKQLLATTTILALTAGFASAEVTTTGTARMGIIDDFGDVGAAFSSRFRVIFTASGETDTGLSFGATVRNDNGADGVLGTAGEVYVSGAFGKISMGDVDGAGAAAVGQVDGVGYTGLSDLNEITYFANGGDYVTTDPSLLYSYSAGAVSLYFSMTNPSGTDTAYGVGAKYAVNDTVTVSAAYESYDPGSDQNQYILGVDATLGGVLLKARYADASFDATQVAVSATYTMNALSMTAFYTDDEDGTLSGSSTYEAYGLGASYDLGGGATVQGGYSKNQTDDTSAVDLGLTFAF